jgi:sec-independent protein translocase protein TatB
MFNLGFGEILLICVILIVVVGPERLPSMMKTVGKTIRTVRQASRDLQTSVGLDELLREDVLEPMPRPPLMPPPAATISRQATPMAMAKEDTESAPAAVPTLPAVGAADAPAAGTAVAATAPAPDQPVATQGSPLHETSAPGGSKGEA